MRLIFSSVLVAMIFLGAWGLAFRAISGRYMVRAESVPIQNMMAVQRYLYEQLDAKVVVVGSSLSGRLQADLLPRGTVNLALGGMSSVDGLRIIVDAQAQPDLVLIEANVLDRPQRTDFLERALAPGLSVLRRHCWSLRDAARPLTVALSYFQAVLRRLSNFIHEEPREASLGVAMEPGAPMGAIVFDTLLRDQQRRYQTDLLEAERRKMLDDTNRLVNTLSQRGVHIVFFEMPTHASLCDLPRAREVRALVTAHYRRFPYVMLGSCASVRTTDGIHLTVAEGAVATLALGSVISSESRTVR